MKKEPLERGIAGTEGKEFIVCPSCGSTDMRWLLGGKLGDQYKCGKCGYEGITLKGNVRFLKELQKRKKK